VDLIDFTRYAAALFVVLGLLGGFAWLARRAQSRGLFPGMSPQAGRTRRMKLVESLLVDARRRLVIVEIDGRETVLLLGANGEQVVDAAIRPAPETGG
jgi:flagellar protein FliO/FliZ